MEINNLVTQQLNNQLQKKPEDQGDVFGEMLSANGNFSTSALSINSLLTKQQDTNSEVKTALNLDLKLANANLTSIDVLSQLVNNRHISEKGKFPLTEFGTSIFQLTDTSNKEQRFSFNSLQELNTVISMSSMTASTKGFIEAKVSGANQVSQTVVESYAWSLLANSGLSQHSTFQFVSPEKNWPNHVVDEMTKSQMTMASKSREAEATMLQRAEKPSNNVPTSNPTFVLDKRNNRAKATASSHTTDHVFRQYELQMNRVSFYLNDEDKRSKLVIRDYFDVNLYNESGLRQLFDSLDFFNISTDEIKLNGQVLKGFTDD